MGTVRLTQRQTNPEAAPNKLKEQVHAVLYKGLNKYSYLLQIYCDIAEVLGREVRRDFLGLHLPHRDDLAEVMAEYDIPLYMIQDAAMIGARRYPPMELVAYGVIDSPEDTDKSEEHVAYLYGIDCALVYMSREDLIVPMEKYQELVPDAPVLPDHLADRYRRR